MLVEVLRLLAAGALLIALPGWLLVNAAFPRRAFRGAERAYLAAAGGVLALMLVATTLGLLPHGERGWYQTLGSGFPTVELSMAAACLFLFWVGLARGAYPKVAARFPRLLAPEAKGLAGR